MILFLLKNLNMERIWFILFAMLLVSGLEAQEYKNITLDSLMSNVKANNLNLKINQENLNVSQASYRESLGAILPQLSVSHQGFRTNNPVMAFGSRLNQGIFTQNDFDVNALNSPETITNFTTTFQVAQPVLNIDKLIQRKAAKYAYQAQGFQNSYMTSALLLKSQTLFMQLQLTYESQKVIDETLEVVQTNYDQANNFYNEGLIQKADVLAAQIRLSEVKTQSQSVEQNIKNLSDELKQLIQDDSESILKPTDSLMVISLWSGQKVEGSAALNTSDVKAFELKKQSYNKLYEAQKYSFLPTLNAFGQFQYFDDDLFGTSSDNYFFGAELKWDLFKGYTRIANLQKHKAEAEKVRLEEQQYVEEKQNDIQESIRAIELSEQQMNTRKVAVEQSEEAFRIINNRYEEGLEKTTDLLMAEARYSNMQLSYLQSVFNYNYNLLYYQFLTEK
jgi:outer membrane protein TolC